MNHLKTHQTNPTTAQYRPVQSNTSTAQYSPVQPSTVNTRTWPETRTFWSNPTRTRPEVESRMRWSHLREFLNRRADCKTCLRCARVASLIAILELIWDVMKSGIDLCAGWLYTTTPLQVSAKPFLPRSADLKHYFWVTFHRQAYFETQFRSITFQIYQKDFPIWHRVQQDWNSILVVGW